MRYKQEPQTSTDNSVRVNNCTAIYSRNEPINYCNDVSGARLLRLSDFQYFILTIKEIYKIKYDSCHPSHQIVSVSNMALGTFKRNSRIVFVDNYNWCSMYVIELPSLVGCTHEKGMYAVFTVTFCLRLSARLIRLQSASYVIKTLFLKSTDTKCE